MKVSKEQVRENRMRIVETAFSRHHRDDMGKGGVIGLGMVMQVMIPYSAPAFLMPCDGFLRNPYATLSDEKHRIRYIENSHSQ